MDVANLSQFTEQALARTIFSLFSDHDRSDHYCVSAAGLFLDYAKQNIVNDEFELLLTLAEKAKLAEKITAQFCGAQLNNTEQRAVLHTVLRAPDAVKKSVLGTVAQEVIDTESKWRRL